MITISLSPQQHDLLIFGLKIATEYHKEKGMDFLAAQTEKLMNEIDILEEAEIKKDDKF